MLDDNARILLRDWNRHKVVVLVAVVFLLMLLVACGQANPTSSPITILGTGNRDPDVAALANLSEQVIKRAREIASDAVLRQINIGLDRGTHSFRLTDAEATQAITIHVFAPDAPPDQWEVVYGHLNQLLGNPRPGIDLQALQVGPAAAGEAAMTYWPNCKMGTLTLIGQRDDLTWIVFCNTAEGVISGTINAQTGAFVPSLAPPVPPPPIATPLLP